MSYDVTQRFTALLSLVAAAAAVILGGIRVVHTDAVRGLLAPVRHAQVWLAWLVAATSMVGSLYFSEHFDLVPCQLCWYQRIAMFSLAVILMVGAIRRDHGVRWYAVPVAAAGAAISLWHQLVEWNPQLESDSCSATVPCSVPYFRTFGFISLSFMALCGFAAIIALLTLAHPVSSTNSSEEHL